MSHLEVRLERDLNVIRGKIINQAEIVATAIENSIKAVETGDEKLAYATVLSDHAINLQMREIDKLCHSFIAIHLPTAGPLRLLSSIIRVNVELERMGDYAVTISREVIQMSHPPQGLMAKELDSISQIVLLMLQQSVSAFRDLNTELAKGTKAMAGQLEYNMNAVYEELMNNTEKERIKDLLAIFVIFNQLKRVSDLSKNLCEHTIFAATGEQKTNTVYNILFVDEGGSRQAPLAREIASNNFSNSGNYLSACFEPVGKIDPEIEAFVRDRGIVEDIATAVDFNSVTGHQFADQHVIVCLQADMRKCQKSAPFHTSVLEWQIEDNGDVESLYRELAPKIMDLMVLLRGEGAD